MLDPPPARSAQSTDEPISGQPSSAPDDEDWIEDPVPLHKLFNALYEHCPTPTGKDNIVCMVLGCLFATTPSPSSPSSLPDSHSLTTVLPRTREFLANPATGHHVYDTLRLLATELLNSFFLPLKGQGRTKSRLYGLRSRILARDGHACVATGISDHEYVVKANQQRRRRRDPPLEGGLKTEAAHIIPHSLNANDRLTGELNTAKHTVWRVMNMFDPGISQSLEGAEIDAPENAILLVSDLHDRFGKLECYFEEILGEEGYIVKVLEPLPGFMKVKVKDVVKFVNNEPDGTPKSALPSRRLLRFHRACCMILSMSGAAGYVQQMLDRADEDAERGVLREDGGSDFGVLLRMRGLCEAGSVSEEKIWDGRGMVVAN